MRTDDVPRTELTGEELDAAVLDNLFDLFRVMTRLPGGELDERDGFSRHHAFPSNPMFKGAWGFRPDVDLDRAIKEGTAWFTDRAAPFSFWWLGHGHEPDGMRAALEARGFDAWEVDAPAMVAELDGLDWDALERVPDRFTIEKVIDSARVPTFADTFVAAFEIPDWARAVAGQAWVDATLSFGVEAAPWELHLGCLDGEPVATNIFFPGAGVASVFGVGTVPGARGQGIGAAITLAPLREARELGYRYAVLFSTDLGLPVYRRIGFRETGSGVTRYLWRAE
jgi:GNAT superfamily N-acetyltransferase